MENDDLTDQLRAAGAPMSGPLGRSSGHEIVGRGIVNFDPGATAPAPQLSEAATIAYNALVDTIGQELDKKLDAVIEAATKIKLALHDEREVVRGAVVELARKTLEDAAPLAEALEREVDDLLARR